MVLSVGYSSFFQGSLFICSLPFLKNSITGVSEILNLLSKILRIGQNNVSDDVHSCDHACHMIDVLTPQTLFVTDEDGILHPSDEGRTRIDCNNFNQITGKNLVQFFEGETVARSVNRREGTVRLNQNAGHVSFPFLEIQYSRGVEASKGYSTNYSSTVEGPLPSLDTMPFSSRDGIHNQINQIV